MPGNNEITDFIKKRFDAMSTAELKEVLYQDSLLPEDECLDIDTILYISKILAEREDSGADKFTSVEESWKKFNDHYRSMESDGKSLYDDSTTAVEPAKSMNHRRPLKSILKVACIAAALLVLLFAGSLVAYAEGYDLWGAVAEWTMETFGFELKADDIQVDGIYGDFEEVTTMLESKGILFDVLPRWLPEGYSYETMEIIENPMKKMLHLKFVSREDDPIGLTIALHKNSAPRSYEKDENLVQTYEQGGIQHYVFQNNEETTIVWMVGNCECYLCGSISSADVVKIIDSIYGG